MTYNMTYKLRLLLTAAALYTTSVFGDSSVAFRDEGAYGIFHSSYLSEVTMYSCQSFVGDESTDLCAGWSGITDKEVSDARKIEAARKSAGFQSVLAEHIGTAAYQALHPKMKAILWMELNKLLNGTGMVALMPDGQKLPVLRGSFDGLFDLILNTLGVNSSIRSGVNLATTISGHKGHIETELKRLLGFNSLESFVERLAQETVLKSMGLAFESYSSTDRSLTLSEIANVQQSVSLEDGRADALSERAADADLNFATGYVWYELRNIINHVVATSIDAHLAELKVSTVRAVKEKLDTAAAGLSFSLMMTNGLAGVIPAAGILALNHTYGAAAVAAGYDVFNQVVTNGLLEVRNIAVLPISKAEIEQFHAAAVTVDTAVDATTDTVVVNSVKESSFGSSFIFGAASTTASKAVGAVKNGVSSVANKLSSWFGY